MKIGLYCTHHIHTSFIATDYTCSPLADAGDLDSYFIPDERLATDFNTGGE